MGRLDAGTVDSAFGLLPTVSGGGPASGTRGPNFGTATSTVIPAASVARCVDRFSWTVDLLRRVFWLGQGWQMASDSRRGSPWSHV